MADRKADEESLARRIAAARAAEAGRKDGAKQGESAGWQIASEFIGAMLAGGFIGWFIDRQLDTGPWGLILLLLLGFATGLYQSLRRQKRLDAANADDNDGHSSGD
ncbi:AtpZ/AtpI family protein [Sandarakinorhabdus rubra]|uniref:AtpZ/AtpI family protein n=1 Tax=Sandarakinorhabdus rubra TaxID=2672568 RepID=UPI0013DBE20C|nr:AtpZ/AtpI family protein [Sandarakinorhabdus rubra]